MVRVLSAALLLTATPATSQDCAQVLERALPPDGYVAFVNAYREGWLVDAVRAVSSESLRELEPFVRRLERAQHDVRSSACLQAAALLHTDVAIMAVQDFEWEIGASHFGLARSLSLLTDLRFQRDWLLAAALFYQNVIFTLQPEVGFRESTRYFEEAIERFPRDPDLLLAAGAVWEWSGSLPDGEGGYLKRAQALYERSVGGNPELPEARLRYGNVLAKRGKYREAEKVLRGILAFQAEDHIIYRAHMGLGSLAEREDLMDEAIRHYRAAVAILPGWQVAYIALSHALHATGAREASGDVLDEALRFPPDVESADAWWSYEAGLRGWLEPLLSAMRKRVLL